MVELERMREAMEKMEEERSQLVAEVEAQIERALASMSMAVEMDGSDDGSETGSHLSDRKPTSRRSSNAGRSPVRPFSTESTLAETDEETQTRHSIESRIIEEDEEEEEEASKTLENTEIQPTGTSDRAQDTMTAVDEGIHQNSDRIAQKVLQIQKKVRVM